MSDFLHILTILFIFFELSQLINIELHSKMGYISGKYLSKKMYDKKDWDKKDREFIDSNKNTFISVSYLLWMFLGLFTENWTLFLILILFNFGLILPSQFKLIKSNNYNEFKDLLKFSTIVSILWLIFITINHFYLHYFM